LGNFAADFAKSKKSFFDIVRPCFLETFGGVFLQTEGIEHEVAKALDVYASVDALWCAKSSVVYCVSLRVQYGTCYNTFTVRKTRTTGSKTEYEKISDAIKNDTTYPHLSLQAYIKSNMVFGAITRTKNIYECIENGLCMKLVNGQDGNGFIAVKWDTIKQEGYKIETFSNMKQ
jgi:hypothetical protein